MISIRDLIHRYAASRTETWGHDRSKTVGASEIGQCARKTWFSKHDAPRDPDYVDNWGAQIRGKVIENEFWVPALRKALPPDIILRFAGDEQETLFDGYLSATTDGLLISTAPDAAGWCINLDCKSIDPRANLWEEKASHYFQVQAQMGLMRDCTKHKPDSSILSYINTSFWNEITEFVIPFSPRIYAQAHVRATQIMTAREAIELPPEGKMAGGEECKYCAWASHCAEVTVAGVPRVTNDLDDEAKTELWNLRNIERHLAKEQKESKLAHAKASENIKSFLRDRNTSKYKGDGWSVSYFPVNGKATLDLAAVKAAGIDLGPFYKTGELGERLRIS